MEWYPQTHVVCGNHHSAKFLSNICTANVIVVFQAIMSAYQVFLQKVEHLFDLESQFARLVVEVELSEIGKDILCQTLHYF